MKVIQAGADSPKTPINDTGVYGGETDYIRKLKK